LKLIRAPPSEFIVLPQKKTMIITVAVSIVKVALLKELAAKEG